MQYAASLYLSKSQPKSDVTSTTDNNNNNNNNVCNAEQAPISTPDTATNTQPTTTPLLHQFLPL